MGGIEKKLFLGFTALSTALVVIGVMVFENAMRSIETTQWLSHTYEVITESEATLSLLKDIETGQRGYVITGNKDYLESYNSGIASIDEHFNHLKTLTTDNIHQQEKLQDLEPIIAKRIELSKRVITLRRQQGFYAAQKVVLTHQGKQEMDEIRKLFFDIESEEKRLLEASRQAVIKSNQDTLLAVLMLLGMSFILLAVSLLIANKYLKGKAALEAKLKEDVIRDELTGLYNRREANRLLKEEMKCFGCINRSFGLVLLDIDLFKLVNDTYGHPVGDEVIKWVALQIRSSIRFTDSAARFGGEEFLIILPNSSLNEVLPIAERTRRMIADTPFKTTGYSETQVQFKVTLSAGIAICSGRSKTAADLLSEADQALYNAKREGRNRCVVFSQTVGV